MKDIRNDNSIEPGFGQRAVSVYGAADALDDFPVLKAFQQYIDAEQAKARKRLLAMGVFFGALMLVVIAIFVALLVSVSSRNQQLNDRLVEFAMKERATGASVVVQPPQDSAAVLALTTKLEEMQRKISEAESKADKAVAEAEAKARQAVSAAEAAKPKPPSAEALEIQSLKAQLAAEKEKADAEKARRREEELEAYRRKHYPELYAPAPARTPERAASQRTSSSRAAAADDANTADPVDQLLDDLDRLDAADEAAEATDTDSLRPIRYFDDGETKAPRTAKKAKAQTPRTTPRPKPKAVEAPLPDQDQDKHSVSVKDGETSVSWGIPD